MATYPDLTIQLHFWWSHLKYQKRLQHFGPGAGAPAPSPEHLQHYGREVKHFSDKTGRCQTHKIYCKSSTGMGRVHVTAPMRRPGIKPWLHRCLQLMSLWRIRSSKGRHSGFTASFSIIILLCLVLIKDFLTNEHLGWCLCFYCN